MFAIFSQVLLLLIFVAVGFTLGRTKIFNLDHTKSLSGLLVYSVLTCNVFKTFSERFTPEYLMTNYRLLLISAAVLTALLSCITIPVILTVFQIG